MNPILTNLRGTIFCTPIPYKKEVLQLLMPMLGDDFVPSLLSTPILGNNINILTPVNYDQWQIFSQKNNNDRIIFTGQQINIIISAKGSQNEEKMFCQFCSDKFKNIMAAFPTAEINRIAFAPTYEWKVDDSEMRSFAIDIFKKQNFHSSNIDSCSFNNVYRIENPILDKNIKFNYVSQFSNNKKLNSIDGKNSIDNYMKLDIDLNTFPDLTYRFSSNEIEDFYRQAPKWNSEFVDFYFNK